MSTLGDVQYIGGYHDACGEASLVKTFQFLLKTPNVLNIPQCIEHPLMYS